MQCARMADHQRFVRALRVVARGLGRVTREFSREGDYTPQQAETLMLIAERGSVSTSSLAVLLGIDPSTASRNLSGLERAGLIARKKATGDARQTAVRLTAKGKRAATSLMNRSKSYYAKMLERLPRSERARATDAIAHLAEILDAEVEDDE